MKEEMQVILSYFALIAAQIGGFLISVAISSRSHETVLKATLEMLGGESGESMEIVVPLVTWAGRKRGDKWKHEGCIQCACTKGDKTEKKSLSDLYIRQDRVRQWR